MTTDALLHDLFQAALNAVVADTRLPASLPEPPKGRTVVIGAGKAAAAMAKTVEDHWPGPLTGLVVTRYDHELPTERIEVVQASHPVPDAAGQDAAKRILEMVQGLTADDLVLCLISGGGSALLALPAPGVSLDDKRAVAKALLKSGADIAEMNCVRKHLSAIKGGRLAAAAHPARVVSLLVSDVPGDDPSVIASGPTVPDPTSFADARAILAKYGIAPPPSVAVHLERADDETPKPGDPRLAGAVTTIIATPQDALDAAAAVARDRGFTPVVLGDAIEGEARDVAKVHAGIARQIARRNQPVPAPAVILSGGETTVTVRGNGRGGRNVEFLLALAVALDGHPGIFAAAFDTDGIDGTEDNAGALLRPDTLARAAALGLDAKAYLADNDGYSFFKALGDLVVTGPTRTNVNDFRVIVVERPAE
ncbi:glycerate kinase type-2 family protein [Azospirillum doebereinerae]|uniref:Glycerate kinase n=1 Tax=Azospirillum doebereinerae TaxID=92933 RepID=A0A433J4D1_9PROT|nr:glycerate kinase [Azospirillum doebereinerae]RUQ66844.1 glycerate kinase [Azospirillum doebereinerae]